MYHRSSIYAVSVGFTSGAENLAWHDTSISASQAHNLWMSSSTHRRNMLDAAFNSAGFGVACSSKSGRPYAIAVVEFGGDARPAQSTPAPNPHVAGGQSVDGVGCTANDVDPPAPTVTKTGAIPGTTSPTPSNGPSKTPASGTLLSVAEPSQTPSTTAQLSVVPGHGPTSPSPSPVTGAVKPKQTPPTPDATATETPDAQSTKGAAGGDVPVERSGQAQSPDEPSLTAAATPSGGIGSGRLPVTVTGAIVAYLFLIRFMGFRRPPRPRGVARHSHR